MGKLNLEITPYIQKLSQVSCENNHIIPEMYLEHNVYRGLRDLDGNGVVTGLTEISNIKEKERNERTTNSYIVYTKAPFC